MARVDWRFNRQTNATNGAKTGQVVWSMLRWYRSSISYIGTPRNWSRIDGSCTAENTARTMKDKSNGLNRPTPDALCALQFCIAKILCHWLSYLFTYLWYHCSYFEFWTIGTALSVPLSQERQSLHCLHNHTFQGYRQSVAYIPHVFFHVAIEALKNWVCVSLVC